MNQSQPEKSELELKLDQTAAEAEASVFNGANEFTKAVKQLSKAIPQSGPIHAINSIGKISAGVSDAAEAAEEIVAGAVRTAGPAIRLSQRALTRIRKNPAAFIAVSMVGLMGLIFLARMATGRQSTRRQNRRITKIVR